MRQRKLLGNALLFGKRRALPRQVGCVRIVTRQQDTQLALGEYVHEVAIERPGEFETAETASSSAIDNLSLGLSLGLSLSLSLGLLKLLLEADDGLVAGGDGRFQSFVFHL